MRSRFSTFAILIGALVVLQSCATKASRPISTSLQDLLVESKPVSGPVLKHHEVFSIAGLLPMPEVGVLYHYPTKQRFPNWHKTVPPSAAIGIARDQTYRLTGTAEYDETYDFSNFIALVNTVQGKAAEAIKTQVEIAAALAELDATKDESKKTEIRNRIKALQTTAGSQEIALMTALAALDEATNKPGVIIAEWSTDLRSEGSLTASAVAEGSTRKKEKRRGYVILGGIRVSHLYFGDDLKDTVLNLQPEDARALEWAALTTYLLQAKYVYYSSALDFEQTARFYAELSKQQLTSTEAILEKIDKVKLALYASAVAKMSNRGNLNNMEWEAKPVALGGSVFELETGGHIDGWQTIHAVVTSGDRLFRAWSRQLGKIERIEINRLELSFPTAECPAVSQFNSSVGALNASLKADKAYIAKTDLHASLGALCDAVSCLQRTVCDRVLSESDKMDLAAAAADIDHVMNTLEGLDPALFDGEWRGWSSLENQTPEMQSILRSLDDSSHEIKRIVRRHEQEIRREQQEDT